MSTLIQLITHPSQFFAELDMKNKTQALLCLLFAMLYLCIVSVIIIYLPLLLLPNSTLAQNNRDYLSRGTEGYIFNTLLLMINQIPPLIYLLVALFVVGRVGVKLYHLEIKSKSLLIICCYAIIPSLLHYTFGGIYVILPSLFSALNVYNVGREFLMGFFLWAGYFYCFFLLIEGIRVHGTKIGNDTHNKAKKTKI